MRVLAVAFCYSVPGLQVYLFRRNFSDLYKNHMEGAGSFVEMLGPWIQAGKVKLNFSDNEIRFWNGAKIHLCHCQRDGDVLKYQGAEIHVLMMDELTHFSEKVYRFLRGRCRLGGLNIPPNFNGKLPMILCGSNPGGIGHTWVRKTFVSAAQPMEIVRQTKEEGGMLRQFVPAKLEDNPTLMENDPDYMERLEGLGDSALVKAMRDGDWNIVAGGALDDVWSSRVVVPRFKVPASWRVDRSFDWGSSHPFSVLWWAQADGTEATLDDGSTFAPPRGSLILLHEWYGAKGANEGLKLPARDVALGITAREHVLMQFGWVSVKPSPGPADNQIRAVSQPGVPTIADEMAQAGVHWTASEKSPGSRKIGLELMRSRIREAGKDHPERPALFVMAHCTNALDHWPVLPRDQDNPDDVDSDSEDHDYDAARYRVLATNQTAKVLPLRL